MEGKEYKNEESVRYISAVIFTTVHCQIVLLLMSLALSVLFLFKLHKILDHLNYFSGFHLKIGEFFFLCKKLNSLHWSEIRK